MTDNQIPIADFLEEEEDSQLTGYETDVDLVYVIDGTGSMQNLLDAVQKTALTLDQRIKSKLIDYGRLIRQLRIRVIVYRDIYVDAQWIQDSGFLLLPDERDEFKRFIESIRASGGGDLPESGLEALHAAINSDWNRTPGVTKHRQIIAVMSDAAAHPLNHPQRKIDPGYPTDFSPAIPNGLPQLQDEWLDLSSDVNLGNGARLLLFTPNDAPWQKIASWTSTQPYTITGGQGIDEAIYEQIVTFVAKSV